MFQSGNPAPHKSLVLRISVNSYTRIFVGIFFQNLRRTVIRCIIHHNEFNVLLALRKYRVYALTKIVFLVINRHEYAHFYFLCIRLANVCFIWFHVRFNFLMLNNSDRANKIVPNIYCMNP